MAEEVTLGTRQLAMQLKNSEFQKRAVEFWEPLPPPATEAVEVVVEGEAIRVAIRFRAIDAEIKESARAIDAEIKGIARAIDAEIRKGLAPLRRFGAMFSPDIGQEVSLQSSSEQSPVSPITASELENRAQTYAEEMLTELDTFNTENPLAEGEAITKGPDREELMKQFKQLFYQHVAKQRVVIPG